MDIILFDDKQYSLAEVCEICNTQETFIIRIVEHGILEPKGESTSEWVFSSNHLVKAKKSARLYNDLSINIEGVSLAIDLLEELNELRQKIRLLEDESSM
mgnify:CR=1 FL=1